MIVYPTSEHSAAALFSAYRLAESDSADEQESQWQLYFKLYCFLDMSSICSDSVEFAFMFEQVECGTNIRCN